MANPQLLTFDAFLDWERDQATRHACVDGEILAREGGTQAHATIQGNLYFAIRSKLRGSPCRPFTADMLTRTGRGNGRYPDVTIDCGPYRGEARTASQPTIIFEILSDSTQREDRTRKLADYNATPSIAHYVMVEQDEPLAYVYSRAHHGEFSVIPQEIKGLHAAIELPSVAIALTMAEVYEGIEFPTDSQPQAGQTG